MSRHFACLPALCFFPRWCLLGYDVALLGLITKMVARYVLGDLPFRSADGVDLLQSLSEYTVKQSAVFFFISISLIASVLRGHFTVNSFRGCVRQQRRSTAVITGTT